MKITHTAAYMIPHFCTLVLFVVGMAFPGIILDPRFKKLFLVAFAFQTLFVMCFYVLVRYRMLIEPALFIFAAMGLVFVWDMVRSRFAGSGISWTTGAFSRAPRAVPRNRPQRTSQSGNGETRVS